MLDVTLAEADEIREAGREQALATVREAYAAAHEARAHVDALADALARVLRTVRTERHLLAVELRTVGCDGEVLELTGEAEPLLELTSGPALITGGQEPDDEPPASEPLSADEPPAGEPLSHDPRDDRAPDEGTSPDRNVAGIPPPTRFLDLPADDDPGRSALPGATADPNRRLGARPCVACDGTGQCVECKGRGKRLRVMRCDVCEGTGRCPRCRGRGVLGRSLGTG